MKNYNEELEYDSIYDCIVNYDRPSYKMFTYKNREFKLQFRHEMSGPALVNTEVSLYSYGVKHVLCSLMFNPFTIVSKAGELVDQVKGTLRDTLSKKDFFKIIDKKSEELAYREVLIQRGRKAGFNGAPWLT